MRRFMRTSDSISDARIAYIMLAAISSALLAMGILAHEHENEIEMLKKAEEYRCLIECADSLRCYNASASLDDRYTAAIRFENAAGELKVSEELRIALSALAGRLRVAVRNPDLTPPSPDELAKLADAFALGAETGDISQRLGELIEIEPASALPEVTLTDHRRDRFLTESASERAIEIFGDAAAGLKFRRERDMFVSSLGNIRLRFRALNAALDEAVYIRLGKAESGFVGLMPERAKELAVSLGIDSPELTAQKELCGFRLFCLSDGEKSLNFVFDSSGRLWAIKERREFPAH